MAFALSPESISRSIPAGIRLLTIGLLLALANLISAADYHGFFIAMVLGHNIVTLVYSRQRMARLFRQPANLWKVGLVAALGLWSMQYYATTFLFLFCAHHTLSETFTVEPPAEPTTSQMSWLAFIRGGLNFFIFLQIAQRLPDFSGIPSEWIGGGLLFFAILFALYLGFVHSSIERPRLTALILFEGTGLIAALIVNPAWIRIEDVVLYHVIFWLFYPLYDQWRRRGGFSFRAVYHPSLGLSVVVIGGIWFLTMSADSNTYISRNDWDMLGYYTAYLHIWSSLFLSRLNPAWVSGIFQPRNTARAEGLGSIPAFGLVRLENAETDRVRRT